MTFSEKSSRNALYKFLDHISESKDFLNKALKRLLPFFKNDPCQEGQDAAIGAGYV